MSAADKYAARPIDLDILLYGDEVLHDAGIDVPDPDLRDRIFLQVPVLELDCNVTLPDSGEALSALVCPGEARRLDADEAFTHVLRERLLP